MHESAIFGWLDMDVFYRHGREFMEAELDTNELRFVGSMDPRDEAKRPDLARYLYEQISAAYLSEEEERIKQIRAWMNVLGAAVVRLAAPPNETWHVPGTQDDRGDHFVLHMCSGTCGERILIESPYPWLCFPDDYPGVDLRKSFRTLFSERVIAYERSSITRVPGDGMLYVVLDVPYAAEMHCPCRSTGNKKYGECHGANLQRTRQSVP